MADDVSTLALRVDSQTALANLDQFGAAAAHLGGVTDVLKAKLLQLNASFLSVNFAKSIVADAAEGQEALGKFEAVLGRFQGKANQVVEDLVAKFNFDTASAQSAVSGMVDTFAKAGMSIEESLDLSTVLNKRAADLEAFTNAQGGVASVSARLTSGILGETEAVKSLGIVINEDMIKTQMLKEKTEGLTFANQQAAKIHARASLILQQSASAEGQVARETDNYSNRVRYLNARIADLRGSLGEALIPTFTKFTEGTTKVVEALNKLSPSMKSTIVAAGALTGAVVTFSPFIAKLIVGFKQLAATQELTKAVTGKTTSQIEEKTLATTAETAAVNKETLAEKTSTAVSKEATIAKNVEASARLRNAKAARLESKYLGGRSFEGGVDLSKTTKTTKKGGKVDLEKPTFGNSPKADDKDTPGLGKRNVGKVTSSSMIGNAFKSTLESLISPFKGLTNIFTNLASKLPLVARFGGSFTKVLGLLGTGATVVGGVITALEVFKNAPKLLEVAFDKLPSVFANLGKRSLSAVKNLTSSAVNYGKELIVKGTLGFAQTAKRLAGFETEATRAYRLNQQIEENNKRRQELIEQEERQRRAESSMLQSQKMAKDSVNQSKLSYTESKSSDTTKLAKETAQRDSLSAQITQTLHRIEQLKTDASSSNVTIEQREIAAEEIKRLQESLENLNADWRKSAEECDKLAESVRNSSKAFEDDQKNYAKNKENNDKEMENATLQANLDNATNHNERREALSAIADKAKQDYEESGSAQQKADSLNADINKIQGQLTSEFADRALNTLSELATTGDFESDDAKMKWSGALVQLEKAGYSIPEQNQVMVEGSAQQLLGQITQQRQNQKGQIEELTTQRDEQQSIANERASRFSAMNAANKALDDENKSFEEQKQQREKEQSDKQQERANQYKNLQNQVNDTYFERQLAASDQYYGDDKLGATQARFSMIQARGSQQWNDSMAELQGKQTKLNDYDSKLSEYQKKEEAGTLTAEDEKKRNSLQSERDKLQGEYDSEYQSAVQKRLSTENELLGLQSSMRDEYMSQAQSYVDEQANAMKESMLADAQAEEEEQQKRIQERSIFEEERRQAVSGQSAVASGSSEAFSVASKIYDRGQEDVPPEKEMSDSTKKIEEYVKVMQEQMMAYYAEQANGLTLSMGY